MRPLSQQLPRRIPFEVPTLPDLEPLATTVRRVLSRWGDVALPPERDRHAILADMRDREAEDRWDGLPLSGVTSAARILYLPEFRDRPDMGRLRRFYPAEIQASTRPGFLGAMVAVYMETYQPGAAHSMELGRALDAARDRLGGRWPRLLERFPGFLDPTRADSEIAHGMLAMADPWKVLENLGVQRPDGVGLMEAAHLAYVRELAPRLREREAVDRLLRWLKPEGRLEPRIAGAGHALDALLDPWKEGRPGGELEAYLTGRISDLYGHPRMGRHRTVWNETAGATQAVFLRWLTRANIVFFLDVVTEVEKSHMWEPRRRFWLELHEEGKIQDASVAFHVEAEQVARRRSKTMNLSFGKQIARGSRAGTSLLILDVGDYVVVEGSHNYKVRVFDKQSGKTPKLHQFSYDCDAITYIPNIVEITHNSNWEWRLREAIRRRR